MPFRAAAGSGLGGKKIFLDLGFNRGKGGGSEEGGAEGAHGAGPCL